MDQNLERKFLAYAVKDPIFTLLAASRKIGPDYFELKAAGTLFRAVLWFVRHYEVIPKDNELAKVLQDNNIPDELQRSVLTMFQEVQLEAVEPTPEEWVFDQFIKYHKQNMVLEAIKKSAELLGDKNVDVATNNLKADLAKIEEKFRVDIPRSGQLDSFAERIKDEFLDRKINPAKYAGLKLGFPSLDRFMGGLVPSSVSIIMAPPKEFKSALAMNICINVARQGKYCYYHANEGTVELFYMRFAAAELGISLGKIKDNNMDAMEESRWLAFINAVEAGQHPILNKIYFDEVPMSLSTPSFIASRIKKLREEGKDVGLVVVDHFGRMTSNDQSQMQDWQRKGQIAQELCGMALSERIPFILLTHVKSSSAKDAKDDDKDFDAYDIERSGQPLKDVDYVFSWRIENKDEFDRAGKKGYARLSLVLSRHSETGSATLNIDGKHMRIAEIGIGGTGQPQQTIP